MPSKKLSLPVIFLYFHLIQPANAQIIATPYISTGAISSEATASTGVAVSSANIFISSPIAITQEISGPNPTADLGRRFLDEGNKAYFKGEMSDAISFYQKALKRNPKSVEAWLDGAVVLEETQQAPEAIRWFRRALRLSPDDPKIHTALGWTEFRSRNFQPAEADFRAALQHNPNEVYALLGLGRVETATQRANQAEYHLTQAVTLAPLDNLAQFWRAQALEAEKDTAGAIEAYKKASANDSYFIEGRYALGRAYMRRNWFHEAATQFSKVLDADPENHKMKTLLQKVRTLWNGQIYEHPTRISPLTAPEVVDIPLPEPGNVPMLRVGIETNPRGRPLPHKALEFQCNTGFLVIDAAGKAVAAGGPNEDWDVRFAWRNKAPRIEILNFNGRKVISTSQPIRVQPTMKDSGVVILGDGHPEGKPNSRRLRGIVEFSLHPNRKAFKIVNIVDLESYTQGVLSAEMPIESPIEALKAQSVVARTNALYAMTVLRRHRKEGYDLCDGEHCQVYLGAAAESARSRDIVAATRGRIVAYRGKIAQVLYASNCGGHTQSGNDIPGWGDTPYWKGVADTPAGAPPQPQSPWELHWWLQTIPPAYCMPSHYIYPSHYRWTRVLSAKSLEEKFNRNLRLGRILGIHTLRRSESAHLDTVLILGSRRNLKIKDETRLRNLLGVGSLRSTLFVVDTEYGPNGRPETFVFHGGGWGHGVGMCQSGAMGRAEKGQTYEDILKAYYPDTQLGSLRY